MMVKYVWSAILVAIFALAVIALFKPTILWKMSLASRVTGDRDNPPRWSNAVGRTMAVIVIIGAPILLVLGWRSA